MVWLVKTRLPTQLLKFWGQIEEDMERFILTKSYIWYKRFPFNRSSTTSDVTGRIASSAFGAFTQISLKGVYKWPV